MFEKLLFEISQCKSIQEATDLLANFIDEHSAELAVAQNSSHNKQSTPCCEACGSVDSFAVYLCIHCFKHRCQ